MRKLVPALLLLALASPLFGQKLKKEEKTLLEYRPAQKVESKDLQASIARSDCLSWNLGASLESVLRRQGIAQLDQKHWVTKIYGGEVCRSDWMPFDQLQRSIDGDYALDSGRKVRLVTRYIVGAPTEIGEFIVAVRDGPSPVLYWRQRPYLAVGVVYDEWVAHTGQRWFEVQEITLLDPAQPEDSDRRTITFLRSRDSVSDINGVLYVSANTR